MIKHGWSLIAQNAVVDKTSNVLSIQSVLEGINVSIHAASVPEELILPFNGQLVTFLYRDDPTRKETAKFSFIFTSPVGETLLEGSQSTEIEHGKRNARVLGTLNSLKLKGSGIYHFEISLDNEHVQTLPLEVTLTPTIEV